MAKELRRSTYATFVMPSTVRSLSAGTFLMGPGEAALPGSGCGKAVGAWCSRPVEFECIGMRAVAEFDSYPESVHLKDRAGQGRVARRGVAMAGYTLNQLKAVQDWVLNRATSSPEYIAKLLPQTIATGMPQQTILCCCSPQWRCIDSGKQPLPHQLIRHGDRQL